MSWQSPIPSTHSSLLQLNNNFCQGEHYSILRRSPKSCPSRRITYVQEWVAPHVVHPPASSWSRMSTCTSQIKGLNQVTTSPTTNHKIFSIHGWIPERDRESSGLGWPIPTEHTWHELRTIWTLKGSLSSLDVSLPVLFGSEMMPFLPTQNPERKREREAWDNKGVVVEYLNGMGSDEFQVEETRNTDSYLSERECDNDTDWESLAPFSRLYNQGD